MATLDETYVAIIVGADPSFDDIAFPFWRGSLEAFWEANQEELNWGHIQAIKARIADGDRVIITRGTREFILVSDVLRLGYLLGTEYDMISGMPWLEQQFLRTLAEQSPKYMERVDERIAKMKEARGE